MIRIGTRASPLARIQADIVRRALQKNDPTLVVEIIPFSTRGDCTMQSLHDIGGKALFTKELQDALLSHHIDGAVHSLKDVEHHDLPLVLGAFLPREDACDVLITKKGIAPDTLDKTARFGTCSPRRMVQAKGIWPNLTYVDMRGNVGTRLKHVENDIVDVTILAAAGLKRLGLWGNGFMKSYPTLQQITLSVDTFVPAAGQGVIAIECLPEKQYLFEAINDVNVKQAALIERAFARHLGGNCRTALGAYVERNDQTFTIRAFYEGRYTTKRLTATEPDFINRIILEIVNALITDKKMQK
jgi:hydroxymethylbilane synthase